MSRAERANWPVTVVRLGEEPKALFHWLGVSMEERIAELLRIRVEHAQLMGGPSGPVVRHIEIRHGRPQ